MDLEKTKRLAMLRYTVIKSNLPKTMQTILFNQAKRNKLTIEQVKILIDKMQEQLEKEEKQKQKREEWQNLNFTCNIF